MSRVARAPVAVPSGVEVSIQGQSVSVKGAKGTLHLDVQELVQVVQEDGELRCAARAQGAEATAHTATTRALLNNMVTGVSQGFERRLELVGVGYRAQLKGQTLNLAIGYSSPVDFEVPEGITIETPTQTEIVVRGVDKQAVGQVAASIRSLRPPEPYKGKGIRYAGEAVVRKEAKKK